jgi:carbohydrate kinase (thermoresistant glucokinase family)
MGASGSGKSTVGPRLASRLAVPFVEGDDLHSEADKQQMAAGHSLDDRTRAPWLARVHPVLLDAAGTGDGVVIACSAL